MLLTSSLTMALAVRAAQLGRVRQLVVLLCITFLCGVCFMSVKYVEYRGKFEHALLPGTRFQPSDAFVLGKLRNEQSVAAPSVDPVQAARGARVFNGTCAACAACRGPKGEGLTFLGPGLRRSGFVTVRRNEDLKAFVIVGRLANDPENQMKQLMPPRGGNPALTDGQIADAVPAQQAGNPASIFDRKEPVQELTAQGFGTLTPHKDVATEGKGFWKNGRWEVVFMRPLTTPDPLDFQFKPGTGGQFAVAVWDGSSGNVGARKQYCNWLPFEVKP